MTDSSGARGEAPGAIEYRLGFRQADRHRVEVEVLIPVDGLPSVRLMMPVWTPGSYLVREYPRQVESISARDGATGAALVVEKTDKNHWRVDCEGSSIVRVEYTVYGREMGVRTNWIEADFAFLAGAATFLTREDQLDRPHRVRIDGLPQWSEIATSLPPESPKEPWIRLAKNFDELVDSPIVLGDLDIQSATVGGVVHHLASLGVDDLWDTRQAMQDVVKIIEVEQKFWGDVPYPEYWFLNLATEAGGGLEHDNSCVLMTSRWNQKSRAKYIDWMSLVSHEFFHAWNVRRLRPRALMQYDYNSEQYLRELWIAEGITSYYDELFVVRAGLCTPKEYLERLSKQIQGVQNTPGRLAQSLTDSSFDAWIKFYRPDENAANSRVSYYTKGALAGLLLDAEIRRRTANQKSLDDCMRLLWQRFRTTGYTNSDFADIASEVAGASIREWLETLLNGAEELDYEPLLDAYGLAWKGREETADAPIPLTPSNVGLEVANQNGRAVFEKILRGNAADAAGIQVGDELVGWDGYRVTPEVWSDRLGAYRAGDRVPATLARRGKLMQVEVELPAPRTPSWNLIQVESPDSNQQARWHSWLGLENPIP